VKPITTVWSKYSQQFGVSTELAVQVSSPSACSNELLIFMLGFASRLVVSTLEWYFGVPGSP